MKYSKLVVNTMLLLTIVFMKDLTASPITFESGAQGSILALPPESSPLISSFDGGLKISFSYRDLDLYNNRFTVKDFYSGSIIDSISLNRKKDRVDMLVYSGAVSESSVRKSETTNNTLILLDRSSQPVIKKAISLGEESTDSRVDSLALFRRDGLLELVFWGRAISLPSLKSDSQSLQIIFPKTWISREFPIADELKLAGMNSLTSAFNNDTLVIYLSSSKDGEAPRMLSQSVRSNSLVMQFSDRGEYDHSIVSYVTSTGRSKSARLVNNSPKKSSKSNEASYVEGHWLTTATTNVNVRNLPSTTSDSRIIHRLVDITRVLKVGKSGEWIEVVVEDSLHGWIHSSLIESAVPRSDSYFIVRDNVNFRDTPSSDEGSKIIKQLKFGTKLVVDNIRGTWLRGKDPEGKLGWVHSSMVADSISITPELWDRIEHGKRSVSALESEAEIEASSRPAQDQSSVSLSEKPQSQFSLRPDDTSIEEESKKEATKEEVFRYTSRGRDPFVPLTARNIVRPALPKVENIKVVGIIYSSQEGVTKYALLEEAVGGSPTTFSVKEGDTVENGRVLRIEQERVIFLMTEAGVSYTVEKKLEKVKE